MKNIETTIFLLSVFFASWCRRNRKNGLDLAAY